VSRALPPLCLGLSPRWPGRRDGLPEGAACCFLLCQDRPGAVVADGASGTGAEPDYQISREDPGLREDRGGSSTPKAPTSPDPPRSFRPAIQKGDKGTRGPLRAGRERAPVSTGAYRTRKMGLGAIRIAFRTAFARRSAPEARGARRGAASSAAIKIGFASAGRSGLADSGSGQLPYVMSCTVALMLSPRGTDICKTWDVPPFSPYRPRS
jgi:hypothetical protein